MHIDSYTSSFQSSQPLSRVQSDSVPDSLPLDQGQYPPASPPPYATEDSFVSSRIDANDTSIDPSATKPDLESRLADAEGEADMIISPIVPTAEALGRERGNRPDTSTDADMDLEHGEVRENDDDVGQWSPHLSFSKRDLQSRLTSRTPSPVRNNIHRLPKPRSPSPPSGSRHLHRLPLREPDSYSPENRRRSMTHQPPTAPLSWRRSPPHPPPTQPAAYRERDRLRDRDLSPRTSPYVHRLPQSLAYPRPPSPSTATTKDYTGYLPRGSYAQSSYSRGRSHSRSSSRSPRSRSKSRSRSRSRSSIRSRSREREIDWEKERAERERERERNRAYDARYYDDYGVNGRGYRSWEGIGSGVGSGGRGTNSWRSRY